MNNNILLEKFIVDNVESGSNGYKFFMSLSESDLPNISDKVVSALYKSAVEKYNYIDFGKIPDSKGDISRFKQFDTINETINMLEEIKSKSGLAHLQELEVIKTSLSYIIGHKKEFMVGFLQNNSMLIMIYNTTVVSIICGLNLIISTMVEYIRTPNADIEAVLSGVKQYKEKDYSLIKSLESFNKVAEKGEIKKLANSMNNKENFALGATAAIVVGTLIAIIPVIRELTYFVFNVRMNVSEYLDQQSEFLKLNSNTLRFSDNASTAKNKKDVINKQQKTAEKLTKLSDKFRINFQKGNVKTKSDLSKKVSVSSIENSLTDMDDLNSSFTLV